MTIQYSNATYYYYYYFTTSHEDGCFGVPGGRG